MKVKELIENLKTFDQEAEVTVSSDEELNVLFSGFEVAELTGYDKKKIVIFGLSGQELDY